MFSVLKIFFLILIGAVLSLALTFSLAFIVAVKQKKVKFSWEKMALSVTGCFIIVLGYIRNPRREIMKHYRKWVSEKDLREYRKAMKRVVRSRNNRAAIEVDPGIMSEVRSLSKHDLERTVIQQTLTLEAYMTLYGARLAEAIVLEWPAPVKSQKPKGNFKIKGKKAGKK